MKSRTGINRRDFLKISATAGAGLVVSIYLQGCDAPTTMPAPTALPPTPPDPTDEPTAKSLNTPEPTATPEPDIAFEPNIYLKIMKDGIVTITAFRSEMGQGVRTAIAMIVAEELDVDWSSVRIEQAPADPAYGGQTTGGSGSVSGQYPTLRRAGAAARQVLVAAAAQTWDVEADSCTTEKGFVLHPPSGQRLSYGELVEIAVGMPMPDRGDIELKAPKDFKIIGSSIGNYDSPQFVTGSAVYGSDVRIPDMLFASVAQCPVFGGLVAGYDTSQADPIEGVLQIVQISTGIAVVAENTWSARQGRNALEITWDEGSGADTNSESMLALFAEQAQTQIDSLAEDALHASYINPFLAHASMEPMNCTADVRTDSCVVWAPTQNPQEAKRQVVRITGLPDEAVTVNVPLIGGGFGRRLEVDYVNQAVEISQAVGAPVQVSWTREDDIQHDYYHPIGFHVVNSRLDEPRMPNIRSIQFSFNVPTGAWRSVGNFSDAFARENFLNELAFELDRDPIELRLEIFPETHRAVLELVVEKSGWGTPLPDGWGRGMACYATFNATPVAQVAEVSVDDEGNVRVHRVVCAVDCGTVINPDNVRAQMEGGIVFGLTAALKAEITVEEGRAQQSNFHDYPILRIDEMPVIETHIVPSSEPPSGIGEMGVPPITPAVLNAIFDATGKRIRRIPVRPEDLREG